MKIDMKCLCGMDFHFEGVMKNYDRKSILGWIDYHSQHQKAGHPGYPSTPHNNQINADLATNVPKMSEFSKFTEDIEKLNNL